MATNTELAERLLKRFKGVPNFVSTDAQELVDDAIEVHGFSPSDDVPAEKVNLVLLYAQSEGAWRISLGSAHYFSYSDGEESVNKANISEQYRKLAQDLRKQYDEEKAKTIGVSFRILKRADRYE